MSQVLLDITDSKENVFIGCESKRRSVAMPRGLKTMNHREIEMLGGRMEDEDEHERRNLGDSRLRNLGRI